MLFEDLINIKFNITEAMTIVACNTFTSGSYFIVCYYFNIRKIIRKIVVQGVMIN